jgi:molybdopterin-guanine dinucleotide biosynthesis protein A
MGHDKAAIEIDGISLAERGAQLLRSVVTHPLEVGRGVTTLFSVSEQPPGDGPLAAIVTGRRALMRRGLSKSSSCLVLACDLPLLNLSVLKVLAEAPSDTSVLPVIAGFAQPLCSRWSADDLEAAEVALNNGEHSLRELPNRSTALLLPDSAFGHDAIRLSDADTPEELAGLLQQHEMDR